ncbi:hypothetical protein [Moorena sp. SIO3I6]|uniref:hypothetical protein n=1 Tax=Moorena sp. SIO3I6 TaxID=2607831 RepID=UPI0013FA3D0F|nr:hypothetical protein [Moorena sp. SIO3I6]NEP25286.1 hypothetical protein [Moorena sp. SIO3I6]
MKRTRPAWPTASASAKSDRIEFIIAVINNYTDTVLQQLTNKSQLEWRKHRTNPSNK